MPSPAAEVAETAGRQSQPGCFQHSHQCLRGSVGMLQSWLGAHVDCVAKCSSFEVWHSRGKSADLKSQDRAVEAAEKVFDRWAFAVHMLQEAIAQAMCPDPFSLASALDACRMTAFGGASQDLQQVPFGGWEYDLRSVVPIFRAKYQHKKLSGVWASLVWIL